MSSAHKLFLKLPKVLRKVITIYLEYIWLLRTKKKLSEVEKIHFAQLSNIQSGYLKDVQNETSNRKARILFYHINGLSFGGTEKFLQIIAKHLNPEKYEVWFMAGPQDEKKSRRTYINMPHIHIVDFTYDSVDKHLPYIVHGSTPDIAEVILNNKIELIVTATPGHTVSPINLVRNIPIININIFGSFIIQKNIKKIIGLSHEVVARSSLVANPDIHEVMYIPSETPPDMSVQAKEMRSTFGILDSDFVFGRIGRPSDDIFDPIALNAFALLQQTFPEASEHCHYIIMAPSPLMIKKVKEENIKNVHFLDPSSREEDVFAFHQAIDTLAHARLDGETCGLNIAESMLCSKPILTHTSHVWNAHLEYLDESFARIAKKDDSAAYMQNMHEFYTIYTEKPEIWAHMSRAAQDRARSLFLIESSITRFETFILEVLDDAQK
jgi:glycosyltransferase involved in cell wall biosynthesis